jgi:hypothetical protein
MLSNKKKKKKRKIIVLCLVDLNRTVVNKKNFEIFYLIVQRGKGSGSASVVLDTISWGPKIEVIMMKFYYLIYILTILESILPNFFLCKTKIFFHFLMLSFSVCSIRKYCLYFKMAKLKSKKSEKRRNQCLVGLTILINKVHSKFLLLLVHISAFNLGNFDLKNTFRHSNLMDCIK